MDHPTVPPIVPSSPNHVDPLQRTSERAASWMYNRRDQVDRARSAPLAAAALGRLEESRVRSRCSEPAAVLQSDASLTRPGDRPLRSEGQQYQEGIASKRRCEAKRAARCGGIPSLAAAHATD